MSILRGLPKNWTEKIQQTSVPPPCNAETDSLTSNLGTYALIIIAMIPLIDLILFLHRGQGTCGFPDKLKPMAFKELEKQMLENKVCLKTPEC